MDENENFDQVTVKGDASSIYENGALLPLKVEELCDNKVAIKQLINQHNLSQINLSVMEKEVSDNKSEIEYLKTTPFFSSFIAVLNIIATIMIAIIINQITEKPDVIINYWLLFLAALLLVVSSISNILYPYVRRWFNKNKEGQQL